MGHHAQYRKRFSTNTGSVYALTPPQAADWAVEWNDPNIRVKFTTAAPAPSTGLMTAFKIAGGEWQQGTGGTIINNFFAIEAGDDSGNYSVRVRWGIVGLGQPTSDWSDSKPITIP